MTPKLGLVWKRNEKKRGEKSTNFATVWRSPRRAALQLEQVRDLLTWVKMVVIIMKTIQVGGVARTRCRTPCRHVALV